MEEIQTIFDLKGWVFQYAWVVEILVVLLALLIVKFFLKSALLRIKRKAHVNENDWRAHLEFAVLFPARALFWLFLISFAIDLGVRKLEIGNAFSWILSLRNVGIVVTLAWFFLRWKKIFFRAISFQRVKGKPSFDPISLEILEKVFTLGVFFVSLLVILQLFGLDIIPLITFGGIGAAALGYASKDVMANFFGGLMLYVTRPFTLNDLIEIPEKKVTGHIEEIGWYFTAIRDLHKKPVYIPNAVFSHDVIINLSRITHRRIEESIGIRYADISKVEPIVEQVRSLFVSHPEIDHHQPINVYLISLAPHALELEVKAYTLATRYEEFMEIKQKILLEIYSLIGKTGAEMAFPRLKSLVDFL